MGHAAPPFPEAPRRTQPILDSWTRKYLRLLWQTPQLPGAQRVPAGGAANLVQLPQAAEPEDPTHVLERVRHPDGSLPVAYASDHSPLGKTHSMTRVILGKSRVRESRMPGSVRAKAEWLSYSTTTFLADPYPLGREPESPGLANRRLVLEVFDRDRLDENTIQIPHSTCSGAFPG